MSVTKQEAKFLKSILADHLDDYVEEIVRKDTDNSKCIHTLQETREAGLSLLEKAGEVNRRASRASEQPYFTNLKQCARLDMFFSTTQFMFDDNEYLDKVTVDIPRRRFTLLSSEGSVKNIDCDNGDEFMRILDFVRDTCTINDVVYV